MVASISIEAKAWKPFQFSFEFQGKAIIQFSIRRSEISWENERSHEQYSQESQREAGWQSSRIQPQENSYLKSKKVQKEKKEDMESECNLK